MGTKRDCPTLFRVGQFKLSNFGLGLFPFGGAFGGLFLVLEALGEGLAGHGAGAHQVAVDDGLAAFQLVAGDRCNAGDRAAGFGQAGDRGVVESLLR